MNISLCMIVKNEEKNIRKSIESVKKVVNEIVVVDTGSSDNTVTIARELGAKVYFFRWIDDFSKAKNYALSKVNKKADWIIFIDADEYYDEASAKRIKDYIKKAEEIKCEFIQGKLININKSNNNRVINMSKNIRIFKNKNYICYEGRIHEYLVNKHGNKRIADTELKLFHTGYSSEVVKQKNKAERNLKLLYEQLDENPENINIKFFIAETLILDKKFEKALYYIDEVINSDDGNIDGKLAGIYERAYYYKLYILGYIAEYSKEVLEFFDECIHKYSEYPDYDEFFGMYCYNEQKFNIALKCFSNCLKKIEKYNSITESMSIGHKNEIQVKLVNCLLELNRKPEAVEFIISILKEEKYNSELLEILLLIFSESESDSAVYDFLEKIYDYNNIKDKLLLIDVSKKSNNNLAELFYDNLTSKEKEHYEERSSCICEKQLTKIEINQISKQVNDLIEKGTQASVKDKESALHNFERAYNLLSDDKLKTNNKNIYVPYIAMLYHFGEYEKVEMLSFEALSLYRKETIGQIDIYYYLGITEIELNKYSKTIEYLCRYFEMIKMAEDRIITNDDSEACYSINLQQNAYYNLAKAYSCINDKKMFIENIYKIDDLNYLKLRLMEIIDLFLNSKYFDELVNYYNDVLDNNFNMDKDLFIRIIDYKKDKVIDYEELKEKLDNNFAQTDYISDEFEGYKKQVKKTIKELIEKRDLFNAESIIKEYEDIVPDDFDIFKLKNELNLLKN